MGSAVELESVDHIGLVVKDMEATMKSPELLRSYRRSLYASSPSFSSVSAISPRFSSSSPVLF